jgi:hypothetical protein
MCGHRPGSPPTPTAAPVAVMRSAISPGRTTRWGGRWPDRWPGRQGSRRPPETNLKPCPENPHAMMTLAHCGWRPITKCRSGVLEYTQVAACRHLPASAGNNSATRALISLISRSCTTRSGVQAIGVSTMMLVTLGDKPARRTRTGPARCRCDHEARSGRRVDPVGTS